MKLMFMIILASCAVWCDESNNNYYVIQMAEGEPELRATKRPLKVYWNVPTGKKCHFKDLYEKYGIIQNTDDLFAGDQLTILYDPGAFPALLSNSSSGEYKFRNGGVPQEGSWDVHEAEFTKALEGSIPDPNFSGIGVIDFESWRPVYRQNFAKLTPYKDISYAIERRNHPLWPKAWVQEEAKQRFESSGRMFMEKTLALAKQLRPKALWGYYAFPYCFNLQKSGASPTCSSNVRQENDGISWLWDESTALFPSVYSGKWMTTSQLSQMVRYRVKEAARVRKNRAPILPYFWYRYRDGGFMSQVDLEAFLKTISNSEASGFIIWGAWADVKSQDKCQPLLEYLENVMGPAIAKYTKIDNTNPKVDNIDMSNEINNSATVNNTQNSIEMPDESENSDLRLFKKDIAETTKAPFQNLIPDLSYVDDNWNPPKNYTQDIPKYIAKKYEKQTEKEELERQQYISEAILQRFNRKLIDYIVSSLVDELGEDVAENEYENNSEDSTNELKEDMVSTTPLTTKTITENSKLDTTADLEYTSIVRKIRNGDNVDSTTDFSSDDSKVTQITPTELSSSTVVTSTEFTIPSTEDITKSSNGSQNRIEFEERYNITTKT